VITSLLGLVNNTFESPRGRGKYSLERHVLSDIGAPTSSDWTDTVSEHGATARATWLAIKSQFLRNRATRALYANADFRTFCQGDLPIVDYCRLYKRKAEDLRDLGEQISDSTLVLNISRRLNERFSAIGLHLQCRNPLPSFLKVRDDLRLEELAMAKAAPATALVAGSDGFKPNTSTVASRLPAPPQLPPQ
jgi:hypothetical protein